MKRKAEREIRRDEARELKQQRQAAKRLARQRARKST
jgi:hypothetical protein